MQPWNLTWQLALRFRGRRERSGFISFISASSTLGIALGCMVFIAGLSVMNGFEKVLQERFLSLIPHVEYTAVNQQLKSPDDILAVSRAHPAVRYANEVIRTQAMVQQGAQFTGVQVHAIDTSQTQAIVDYVAADAWQALQKTSGGVVLGHQLAQKLKLTPGDKLMLLVAQNANFKEPKRVRLEVVGTFNFGGQVDHQYAYVNLATGRDLVGLEQGATAIELYLHDVMQAQQVANEVGYRIQDYVYIDHWMRSQGHLYRDIQLVRFVMYLVLILVLAVACFNIVSTLIMTVQEKQRHIGILRTMGLRAQQIMRVFIWQGLQNGLVGVAFGVLAGVALTLALPNLMAALQWLTGSSLLASDVYFINQIPVDLQIWNVVMVAAIAVIMSVLATIYPAWRAAKTEIVRAISG
ncbi:lipoprotein-releasing system transmembrane subunit, LolC/LolE family [Pseudidiomarina donghaiensis]|uniref:Lipoprotein-releasing system transmembrane subunit, LolC/LolE family n=2 Tax=Pseudidiomarina donghaiensis TaxID=519452 RepID=A0A432XDD4_9GAMM|nr:lipoprotein-releasing system transmembrane subunit, LolC/LolE family [Pseudidiomarina donghaiensis]